MNPYLSLFSSIGLAIIAQILLKLAMLQIGKINLHWNNLFSIFCRIFFHPLVLLGLFLLGISAFLWLVSLSNLKLSYAYPMVAISYVALPVFSHFFFGEPLTLAKIFALSVIVSGIILLSKFS
ncbi:MAG: cation/cationic drug transporter [Candidatus Omnitrophota bacterium]|nr:MAG: cation/cationic drug transporter [Candidatus Omnitrophota bacterium]